MKLTADDLDRQIEFKRAPVPRSMWQFEHDHGWVIWLYLLAFVLGGVAPEFIKWLRS